MSHSGRDKNYNEYLNKYDTSFVNKYQSWSHHAWGRKSNFLQLVYFRAYLFNTGSRAPFLPHLKFKNSFNIFCAIICMADIYGVWIYQEIYNKYMPWKWTMYQPYFKESCILMEYIIFVNNLETFL
jgi:hypothetical protein